jgi:hypothetical protein
MGEYTRRDIGRDSPDAPELAQVFALFGVLTRQTRVSDDCRLACTPNGGKGADLAISTFCCGQQIVDSN